MRFFFALLALGLLLPGAGFAQVIVLDPGHGYGATVNDNPDGRSPIEIETSLDVGLKTRALIQNSCTWTAHLTRTTNINGFVSITQRAQMANNWNADVLLSIHCNAGGGTGTETFYCNLNDPTPAPDLAFSQLVQARMVAYGQMNNRRCVEDFTYLRSNGQPYHLGVLTGTTATGCLNELGFVDFAADAAKLTSDPWRATAASAYFDALKTHLNSMCGTAAPGGFSLTATPECNGSSSQIKLTWTPSANAASYQILRNGTVLTTVAAGTQYTDAAVTAGTAYTYSARGVNPAGNTANANGNVPATARTCAVMSSLPAENPFEVRVVPNPSAGVFHLTASQVRGKVVLMRVVDEAGKVVFAAEHRPEKDIMSQVVDLSAAAAGLYFLQVVIDGNGYSSKLSKL